MTPPKEPVWLLTDAVIAMHKMLLAQNADASADIRDFGLLESALGRPKNLFGDADTPVSVAQLAASYAFGIAKNHPFVDGNKRVALTASAVFLEINGLRLVGSEAEAVVVFENLASGDTTEDELAAWFEANTQAQ